MKKKKKAVTKKFNFTREQASSVFTGIWQYLSLKRINFIIFVIQ